MSEHTLHLLLREHVPAPAVAYCLQLWQQQPFDFKLRKSRATKVGDFTCRQGKKPRITVNRDSHPFLFLITYIHEVAHLVVHQQYGWKVEAHGKIWKETFIRLLNPVMTDEIFPPALLTVLRRHMRNPKASSFSDANLTQALRQYDPKHQSTILLSDLAEGTVFGIRGRWFKKGPVRRTRALCRELSSKRNYLVPVDSPVESAQLSLLS